MQRSPEWSGGSTARIDWKGVSTETTEYKTGRALWEWLVWSNPIVEMVFGSLSLTNDERSIVQQTLEKMVRERAGGSNAAKLTNPVNIGVGIK